MEPIAITGLSCRFPHVEDSNAFWALLTQGQDTPMPVVLDDVDQDQAFDQEIDLLLRLTGVVHV